MEEVKVKNIDKLEDLSEFIWEHNGRTLRLAWLKSKDEISVYLNNFRENWGVHNRCIFTVRLFNLNELEFLGLRVIMNVKITRKERDFLKCFRFWDSAIIKDSEGQAYIGRSDGTYSSECLLEKGMFDSLILSKEKQIWTIGELLNLEVME